MAVGSWDPTGGSASAIDADLLTAFIACAREQRLDDLPAQLDDTQLAALPALMQLEAAPWLTVAGDFSEQDLIHLIEFFAIAENLPGCEAGEKSPVIPLARLLRQRGARPDKDLLKWIRGVNNNRFLPYGPL